MRYIQPTILRTDNAAAAIQSVGSTDTSKPDGQFQDTAIPMINTTVNAYEADE